MLEALSGNGFPSRPETFLAPGLGAFPGPAAGWVSSRQKCRAGWSGSDVAGDQDLASTVRSIRAVNAHAALVRPPNHPVHRKQSDESLAGAHVASSRVF